MNIDKLIIPKGKRLKESAYKTSFSYVEANLDDFLENDNGSSCTCKPISYQSYNNSSQSVFNPRSRADEYELSCYYDTLVDNKKW
jgi:hypothetical protein